ncbi:MAG: Crp/Fnr family transcriptional regulator [Bacteroidetes bacterium]|nr:Crp/Fnr family transcriptional regulator [Bacteroidota bacterium]
MVDFPQFCRQFTPLDQFATDELFKNLKIKAVQKGDYLLRTGEVCRYLFFINEGLVKSFFFKNGKEFVMRFFSENVLFTVFDSYLTQTPSNFNIVALENTTVTMIGQTEMERLCKKYHGMETFFRKLVSIATVKMMKRISEMLEENATERYHQFVKENNPVLQRISLGDLASYLGITQQSLSRIRAKK